MYSVSVVLSIALWNMQHRGISPTRNPSLREDKVLPAVSHLVGGEVGFWIQVFYYTPCSWTARQRR